MDDGDPSHVHLFGAVASSDACAYSMCSSKECCVAVGALQPLSVVSVRWTCYSLSASGCVCVHTLRMLNWYTSGLNPPSLSALQCGSQFCSVHVHDCLHVPAVSPNFEREGNCPKGHVCSDSDWRCLHGGLCQGPVSLAVSPVFPCQYNQCNTKHLGL